MTNKDRGDIKKDLKYQEMYGIPLFGSSTGSLLKLMEEKWSKQVQWIATVNPEFVMNALKDRQFINLLINKTTINVVDGVGLVWGNLVSSEQLTVNRIIKGLKIGVEILMGRHRETLITGADLMDRMCQVAEEKKRTVFFLGGWGDRAKHTAEYFLKKYPQLKVVGAEPENYDFKIKADYLFVALGMKKQEEWIGANIDKLKVNLVMGVGRSFDYYSGDLKRAPEWIRKMGMEWLFSLLMEPKRWRRQLVLPKFIFKILMYNIV